MEKNIHLLIRRYHSSQQVKMPEMWTWVRRYRRAARSGDTEHIARFFTLFLQPVPEYDLNEREKYCKYKFQPGRAQYDPTLQVLKVMIADLVGNILKVASVKYELFPSESQRVRDMGGMFYDPRSSLCQPWGCAKSEKMSRAMRSHSESVRSRDQ